MAYLITVHCHSRSDLNNNDFISTAVNDLIGAHYLSRLDVAYPSRCTYFSKSLNAPSCLDYFLTNNIDCTAGIIYFI